MLAPHTVDGPSRAPALASMCQLQHDLRRRQRQGGARASALQDRLTLLGWGRGGPVQPGWRLAAPIQQPRLIALLASTSALGAYVDCKSCPGAPRPHKLRQSDLPPHRPSSGMISRPPSHHSMARACLAVPAAGSPGHGRVRARAPCSNSAASFGRRAFAATREPSWLLGSKLDQDFFGSPLWKLRDLLIALDDIPGRHLAHKCMSLSRLLEWRI